LFLRDANNNIFITSTKNHHNYMASSCRNDHRNGLSTLTMPCLYGVLLHIPRASTLLQSSCAFNGLLANPGPESSATRWLLGRLKTVAMVRARSYLVKFSSLLQWKMPDMSPNCRTNVAFTLIYFVYAAIMLTIHVYSSPNITRFL